MSRVAPALVIFAALVPVTAQALSCAAWSPAQAYEMADASASRYSVVVGTFDFGVAALPKSAAVVPAVLTGRALARTGFDAPYSKQVRLEVSCAASWCGSVAPDHPYLVFVEQSGAGPTVALGPCPTVVFPNPSDAVERDITRCLTSTRCDTN